VTFSKSNDNNSLRCFSDNWINAIIDFKEHSNKSKNACMVSSDHFIDVIKHPTESIMCKIKTKKVITNLNSNNSNGNFI